MKKYYFTEVEPTFAERQAEEIAKQDSKVASILREHQSRGYSNANNHEVDADLRDCISAILERNKRARERFTNK